MLKSTKQTSLKYKIASFNKQLHKNGICPANHEIGYAFGWYYFDGEPKRRPSLTKEAKELEDNPSIAVYFSSSYNTYVFKD